MAKYILGILVIVFLGALYYRGQQSTVVSPRDAITREVANVKSAKGLDSESEQVLRVQLAILNYSAAKGVPPNSLQDLVPDYFDAVPRNPKTNTPFEYKRDGATYILKGSSALDSTQVASNTGKEPADRKGSSKGAAFSSVESSAAKGMISDADFINPNTMVPDSFVYDVKGKRDPFRSFDFSSRPQNASASTPLERYSLGQLRLTAVIMDSKGGTAFVEDAAGKGYPIRVGAKIGDQGGAVVDILPDRIKILESTVDFAGVQSQREVEMMIQSSRAILPEKGKGRSR